MRLFLVLVLLFVPLSSVAQQTKPVEVTNFPAVQDVEVLNLPAVQDVNVVNAPPTSTSRASRFQLVGFTSASYTGDMGGHFGVTRKCQLEFAESRMCTFEEVAATTSIPDGLAGDAWAHPSGGGRVLLDALITKSGLANCDVWKDDTGRGRSVTADGTGSDQQTLCSVAQPVASLQDSETL